MKRGVTGQVLSEGRFIVVLTDVSELLKVNK